MRHLAGVRADGGVRPLLPPRHARDDVVGGRCGHQLGDVAGLGVPEEHGVAEGDSEQICGGPVEEVEVVVVDHVGRVEDLLGGRGDVDGGLLLGEVGDLILAVKGVKRADEALGGGGRPLLQRQNARLILHGLGERIFVRVLAGRRLRIEVLVCEREVGHVVVEGPPVGDEPVALGGALGG